MSTTPKLPTKSLGSVTDPGHRGRLQILRHSFARYALIGGLSLGGFFAPPSTCHANSEALERLSSWVRPDNPRVRSYSMLLSPSQHQIDELVQIAQDVLRTRNSTEQALLVIYASYQQLNHPRRSELLQILRDFAEPETKGEASDKKSKLTPHETFSSNRVRMSALAALVQSGDRPSLAYVLAMASSPIDEDPWGRNAARQALYLHPHLPRALEALAPLLSTEQIDQLVKPALDTEPIDLVSLVRKTAQDVAGYSSRLALLGQQLRADEGRGLSRDEWNKALETNVLWTLRTTSLLYASMPTEVLALARREARRYESDTGDRGSAARFFRAIDESSDHTAAHPSSASESPKSPRPVYRTPSLREHWANYKDNGSPRAISYLCSTFAPATGQLTPPGGAGLSQLRRWLDDPRPQRRAACIWGLSQTRPPALVPDLVAAYLKEDEPSVRSALVFALSRYFTPEHPLLRSAAALDGDAFTRSCAGNEQQRENAGFFFSMRTPCDWVSTRRGRSLLPHAAEDGFCAVVAPDL